MIYIKFNISFDDLMNSLKGVSSDEVCVLIPNIRTDFYFIALPNKDILDKLLPEFMKYAKNHIVITESELLKVSPALSGAFLHTIRGNRELLPW